MLELGIKNWRDVCVFVYVFSICVQVCAKAYVDVSVSVCACVCACGYVCMYVCMYVCLNACTCGLQLVLTVIWKTRKGVGFTIMGLAIAHNRLE